MVNNCYVPITIRTFGLGTDGLGVGVDFDVVRAPIHIISDGERQGTHPLAIELENSSIVTISPKKDLPVSVPAESVKKAWYIQVRFDLGLTVLAMVPTILIVWPISHGTTSRRQMDR